MANVDQIIEDLIAGVGKHAVEVERKGKEIKLAGLGGVIDKAYEDGMKAAAVRFKVAFLGPMVSSLASLAAPALASKVAPTMMGALAKRPLLNAAAGMGMQMGAQKALE